MTTTYRLEIIMDADDKDDFIDVVMSLNRRELREHVKEMD